MITSLDQTSKCHFLLPSTPHITEPLWMPMRMLRSTCRINNSSKNHKLFKARARALSTHTESAAYFRVAACVCYYVIQLVSVCCALQLGPINIRCSCIFSQSLNTLKGNEPGEFPRSAAQKIIYMHVFSFFFSFGTCLSLLAHESLTHIFAAALLLLFFVCHCRSRCCCSHCLLVC